jgi:hypothetical protein
MDVENSSEAALIMMTAFIGAVFGCIGCFAATISQDAALGVVAASGASCCGAIWFHYLRSRRDQSYPDD